MKQFIFQNGRASYKARGRWLLKVGRVIHLLIKKFSQPRMSFKMQSCSKILYLLF